MFILCLKDREDEGAYAVSNSIGEKILLIFEEADDAERYSGLLEADDFPTLIPIEVDPDSMISMCEKTGYSYMIINSEELIIPPSHNTL
jgi:hypothetical protein